MCSDQHWIPNDGAPRTKRLQFSSSSFGPLTCAPRNTHSSHRSPSTAYKFFFVSSAHFPLDDCLLANNYNHTDPSCRLYAPTITSSCVPIHGLNVAMNSAIQYLGPSAHPSTNSHTEAQSIKLSSSSLLKVRTRTRRAPTSPHQPTISPGATCSMRSVHIEWYWCGYHCIVAQPPHAYAVPR